MIMPTIAQMQQTTEIAAQTFADQMNITVIEAITNYSNEIFHLVCAFAATAQIEAE